MHGQLDSLSSLGRERFSFISCYWKTEKEREQRKKEEHKNQTSVCRVVAQSEKYGENTVVNRRPVLQRDTVPIRPFTIRLRIFTEHRKLSLGWRAFLQRFQEDSYYFLHIRDFFRFSRS